MKQLLLCLSLTLSLTSFSQIKVDDVGEGWKDSVNAAILKIKDSDPFYHVFLNANCNHISYTMAAFSTTEGDSTILISTRQMKAGYVNDIAATLVHESLHLYLKRLKLNLSEDEEDETDETTEVMESEGIHPAIRQKLMDYLHTL